MSEDLISRQVDEHRLKNAIDKYVDKYGQIKMSITQFNILLEQNRVEAHAEPEISINLYDIEEIHDNCTVQILKNTITGDVSVGWWENED